MNILYTLSYAEEQRKWKTARIDVMTFMEWRNDATNQWEQL